jgi:cellulose synthase/poly-beta-1,6-N-acetylglucosamine synthase-like glycosyltransferase
MITLQIIFWVFVFIIFYTYIGYGILLYLLVKIKRMIRGGKPVPVNTDYEPEVTLFIAAYNEKDYVADKMKNTLSLDYPKEKLHILWVTDGSDDGTPDLIKQYNNTVVHHLPERNGKISAMNRGMQFVKTPIVIFSDANTMLGHESIRRIVRLFGNEKVGCVSGEKRIFNKEADTASGAGEGLYWKYESALKKWDAELYSVVGAAGELFAIRTAG